MPNRMALQYLLSLGIIGAVPFVYAVSAAARSASNEAIQLTPSHSSRVGEGWLLSVDKGQPQKAGPLALHSLVPGVEVPNRPVVQSEVLAGSEKLESEQFDLASASLAGPEAMPLIGEDGGIAGVPGENTVESMTADGLIDKNIPADISSPEGLVPESSASFPDIPEPADSPSTLEPAAPLVVAEDDSVSEEDDSVSEDDSASEGSREPLSSPAERSEVFAQAAFLQQGDETSARLRGGGIYVLSPSVFAGATLDLSTGESFSDTDQTGLSLNELYVTASPAHLPELRFSVGLLDLTAYLDRNSFAKDSVTQFFNPVFQTNPALSTVNVSSRPGALVNWAPVDELSLTAVTYSSRRGLGDFSLDSFAGEIGLRFGNGILRGTYVTSRDGGQGDGFQEIFSVDRGNGQFGPLSGDREESFGLNAEVYIPEVKLGIFGRYGWYTNVDLGASGQTYSLGLNGLDVFLPNDRLGLGYGRQLSNDTLRQASGGTVPDVWELFYDAEVVDRLRVGVSLQQRNAWTETYLGFRVRYDLRWNDIVQEGP